MADVLDRRFGVAAAAAALITLVAFGSASSSSESASKWAFVKSTVSSHDVVIFSKSYCLTETMIYWAWASAAPLCLGSTRLFAFASLT